MLFGILMVVAALSLVVYAIVTGIREHKYNKEAARIEEEKKKKEIERQRQEKAKREEEERRRREEEQKRRKEAEKALAERERRRAERERKKAELESIRAAKKEFLTKAIETKLVGVTYCNDITNESRQRIIADLINKDLLWAGQELELKREPSNRFDSHAVAVWGPDGRQIGYLPKEEARTVFNSIGNGNEYKAVVTDIVGNGSGYAYGIRVRLEEYAHEKQRTSSKGRDAKRGEELYNAKKYDEAMPYLWNAAKEGDPLGLFILACCYDSGAGVPMNPSLAAQCYREAAEKGYAPAQHNLSIDYREGCGVTTDYQAALYWAQESAKQDYPPAHNDMGIHYEHGLGVEQDYLSAFRCYIKAASLGDADGASNTGIAYLIGRGTLQDFKQAAYWNEVAAEKGHTKAQCNLARQYMKGDGVKKDYTKALQWAQKAKQSGSDEAILLVMSIQEKMAIDSGSITQNNISRNEADSMLNSHTMSAAQKRNYKIGDIIHFGQYYQLSEADGKESISWIVLDVKDGKALLVTEDIIDYLNFDDTTRYAPSWEDSSIRKWLNGHFIKEAFTPDQQQMIIETQISNDDECFFMDLKLWEVYNKETHSCTKDRVFLLSITETVDRKNSSPVLKHILSDASSTLYAESKNELSMSMPIHGWWLRTDVSLHLQAVYAFCNAYTPYNSELGEYEKPLYYGPGMKRLKIGVRPALWVDTRVLHENAESDDDEYDDDEYDRNALDRYEYDESELWGESIVDIASSDGFYIDDDGNWIPDDARGDYW